MRENWLHVDFKGIIPEFGMILRFVEFWKQCGFNGLILEYDARIPWKTWKGTWRGGLTMEQVGILVRKCHDLGLETVPLIQIHGHLEWLLGHEKYACLREADYVSELCPNHPDTIPLLKKWIDEVAALHPWSRYIHLGCDEAWHIGSCRICSKIPKKEIYLRHVSAMAGYAVSKKLTPMIWGDFFLRENAVDSLKFLPEDTILVDWNYSGKGPYPGAESFLKAGRRIFGASGLSVTGGMNHIIMSNHRDRIENALAWTEFAQKTGIGLMHTTWGRGTSMGNLYNCWFGIVPAFIAAGNYAAWKKHPWFGPVDEMSEVIIRENAHELWSFAEKILSVPAETEIEKAALRWFSLAMRYQGFQKKLFQQTYTRKYLPVISRFVGEDEYVSFSTNNYFHILLREIQEWEADTDAFFREFGLTDRKEFLASRSGILKKDIRAILAEWNTEKKRFRTLENKIRKTKGKKQS